MKNKIIIGSNGQLGRNFKRYFQANAMDFVATTRDGRGDSNALDLESLESIRGFFAEFERSSGKKTADVYLCGALTHVDRCETETELCDRVNHQAVVAVAKACKRYGHKLIFYSSEYVFGASEWENGEVGPFAESDSVNPPCEYGRSKARAEQALLEMSEQLDFLIIRTTILFSWEPEDMNFVMQFHRFLKNALEKGTDQKFRLATDQITTPTYAPALVEASLRLVEKGESGVFHIVGNDLISRADFSKKLIEAFGFSLVETAPFVDFCATREIGQKAPRPLTAGLSTEKAKRLGVKIWNLQDSLAEIQKLAQK